MRILVLTSCTGQKAVDHERRLTPVDFSVGGDHLKARERELSDLLTPARSLYTGQQHVRLMRGIDAALQSNADLAVDLRIVSAGYGLVSGDQLLAPYESTFQGLKRTEARKLAERLELPKRVRELLSLPYDLVLVLLGDDYLEACDLAGIDHFGGPTLIFCGSHAAQRLPASARVRVVQLSNSDAKRFSCGLVGLKGELAGSLIHELSRNSGLLDRLFDPGTAVLSLLTPRPPVADPRVDWVVQPSEAWWRRSRRREVKYFIPDWNDLVDPYFDFEHDRPGGTPAHWTNQVYAHQLYGEPQYDGILVSRAVLDNSNAETVERLYALGIHRYLRVGPRIPVMGDCGAFAYVKEAKPPYSTEDVVEYYTKLGFDLGVSIDHLIPPYRPKGTSPEQYEAMKRERYDLTIENAEAFLRLHGGQAEWTPVGAVQGWDPASYAAAAKHYVDIGYRYVALGALVPRSRHPQLILPILEAVNEAVRSRAGIHLFGVATPALLPHMRRLGVSSVDSASMLRKAWEGHSRNYLTLEGWYPAVRIEKPKRTDPDEKRRMERVCLSALRAFAARREAPSEELVKRLAKYEYDYVDRPERRVAEPVTAIEARIRRVLEDRPWEKCQCAVCRSCGVEVIVFRGNNRNRRRGFHNTWVFYRYLDALIDGTATIRFETVPPAPGGVLQQLALFPAEERETA